MVRGVPRVVNPSDQSTPSTRRCFAFPNPHITVVPPSKSPGRASGGMGNARFYWRDRAHTVCKQWEQKTFQAINPLTHFGPLVPPVAALRCLAAWPHDRRMAGSIFNGYVTEFARGHPSAFLLPFSHSFMVHLPPPPNERILHTILCPKNKAIAHKESVSWSPVPQSRSSSSIITPIYLNYGPKKTIQ